MAEAIWSTLNGSNLCLLLLGKTGHGKSASGNSILGVKLFKSSPSPESVTSCAERAYGYVNGRQVVVVDTPGLVDTRLDTDASAEAAMDAFERGVSLCPYGFHALVLVFRFGMRMTEEEKSAIEKLKEILGKDFIREYAVLLFTHGDNFDPEEVNMTFNEWIRSEGGHLGNLVKECDNRCVLFNNKSTDVIEKSHQRQKLLEFVDGMQSKGKRYNKVLFNQSRESWNKLIRQRKDAKVIAKVNAAVADISNDLLAAQQYHGKIEIVYFESLRLKLFRLRVQIRDMEEGERRNMEREIRHMNDRILSVNEKQEDGEMERAEMERMKKEAEELERQRKQNERLQTEAMRKTKEEHERQMAELECKMEDQRIAAQHNPNACVIS